MDELADVSFPWLPGAHRYGVAWGQTLSFWEQFNFGQSATPCLHSYTARTLAAHGIACLPACTHLFVAAVVLATFYVMRSWSMWLGRTRRRGGMAPELAGFGAVGAQVRGAESEREGGRRQLSTPAGRPTMC